ncbi:MAG: acyltransferase domain-containing protein [Thaumarchaeota archaeon]|nr:acyltransferase domain-containing protein [Nitrososphaerota archaeon]
MRFNVDALSTGPSTSAHQLTGRSLPDSGGRRGPVFVYSSQGGQWRCMGQTLYAEESVFRDAIHQADSEIQRNLGWSLTDEFLTDQGGYKLHDRGPYIQPAVTAVQMALAAVLDDRGIEPSAVTGLSMGEVAATFRAGVLGLSDSFRIVSCQSRTTQGKLKPGKMAFVRAAPLDVEEFVHHYGDAVAIAAELSPALTVVAGEEGALEGFRELLRGKGVPCGLVNVGFAFHTPEIRGLEDDIVASLKGLSPRTETVPVYSSVTGKQRKGGDFDAAYWWRIMSERARFLTTVGSLLEDGYQTFLEIGPHPTLSDSISESARGLGKEVVTLATMKRNQDERSVLRESLDYLGSHRA